MKPLMRIKNLQKYFPVKKDNFFQIGTNYIKANKDGSKSQITFSNGKYFPGHSLEPFSLWPYTGIDPYLLNRYALSSHQELNWASGITVLLS